MIKAVNLTKIYQPEGAQTKALDKVSLTINPGEFVAITGPSGSGKSTLMHILGCLDTPTSGAYELDGQQTTALSDDELARIRNQKIGFVFQAYNLLPRTTAVKNVALPMVYGQVEKEARQVRAVRLLQSVGLGDRLNFTTNQLSGGQQQRVAIARALAMNPAIILADEPTGNLATAQAQEIMAIFTKLNKDGHTIIIITHEPDIARFAKRTVSLKDGGIVGDKKR